MDSEGFFGSVLLFSCSSSLQEVLLLSWQLDEMFASGDAWKRKKEYVECGGDGDEEKVDDYVCAYVTWVSSNGGQSSQTASARTNFGLAWNTHRHTHTSNIMNS